MRLIDAEKCPFCVVTKVNESDERLDICRQKWNYCPVCGRFIGDKVVAKNETTTTETVYNRGERKEDGKVD